MILCFQFLIYEEYTIFVSVYLFGQIKQDNFKMFKYFHFVIFFFWNFLKLFFIYVQLFYLNIFIWHWKLLVE